MLCESTLTVLCTQTTSELNSGAKFSLKDIRAIDIPILVVNLPNRLDRKAHTKDLLAAVGFTTVSFPQTLLLNAEGDNMMHNGGWIAESFKEEFSEFAEKRSGHIPDIASTLTMLLLMRKALDLGLTQFGIFEDDLMIGLSPLETNTVIRRALLELPATADLLYLEACYGDCENWKTVPGAPHLLQIRSSSCTGAIIYTAKGAVNVLENAMPVYDWLGKMLPDLVSKGKLEVK